MSAEKPMSPEAIAAFDRAFGAPWRKGPIPTALDVLSRELRAVGAWQAPRLPEPALKGSTEVPLTWTRRLTADEMERQWIVGFDKHAAYLGVLGSLELGIGDPRHNAVVDVHSMLGRHYVSQPGYWRVRCTWPPPDPGRPDPLGRDRSSRKRSPGGFWVTTPTHELAIEAGLEVEVLESWTWPVHRRLLRPFGERCHSARKSLTQAAGDVASLEALSSVKAVYGATLGGFLARIVDRKREPHPPWYRPDWRHAIIAKARANLWRNFYLARWSPDGTEPPAQLAPVGIFNDAVYFATDELGAELATAIGVPLNDSLGGYSIGTARRLREVTARDRLSWTRLFGKVMTQR
jgi:hypothetical protein